MREGRAIGLRASASARLRTRAARACDAERVSVAGHAIALRSVQAVVHVLLPVHAQVHAEGGRGRGGGVLVVINFIAVKSARGSQ